MYDIPKGRKDGTRSKIEDTFNLPPPFFNASQLIRMFGQHGFSAKEMVALSGNYMPDCLCYYFCNVLNNLRESHFNQETLTNFNISKH